MVLPDGWCVHLERNTHNTSTLPFLIFLDAGPVLLCYTLTSASLVVVYWRVNQSISGSEVQPLIQNTRTSHFRVARSIVNYVLLSFVICYSAAVYNEVKQLVSVASGQGFPYVHFTEEGVPLFNEAALFVFRLKFALTTTYTVINPILVFRGSAVFRNTLTDILEREEFSYVITNHPNRNRDRPNR